MPHAAGVVLSLARLNRILEVDPLARTARVQPGVRNLQVSEAAAAYGLYYAPDPSSQIACSIGGNVAENSGGVHCLKYGLTVHNVMRVRGFTIDGELLELGSGALDGPGLDLLAVAIGSEGLLLVVTEVTVKLVPRPQLAQLVMASFDDVVKAGDAVAAIIAAGIIPAGLEMMDRKATAAVEPFVKAGYDLNAEAILLAEADGTPEEVAAQIGEIEQRRARRRRHGDHGLQLRGRAAALLVGPQECLSGRRPHFAGLLLHGRHHSPQESRPHAESHRGHGTARTRLRCMNVFHAGDGNLHPLILFDANAPGEWQRADLFGAEILELCVKLGGTITGEHGVGIEKINSMCVQFSPRERAAFFAVKKAFDPARDC